jgi:hypothetical protein
VQVILRLLLAIVGGEESDAHESDFRC